MAPAGIINAPGIRPAGVNRRWAAVEFAGLIIFQAVHQMEHSLEVVEKRLAVAHVHPLVGLEAEWIHFGVNAVLFGCLLAVVICYGRDERARWRAVTPVAWGVLVTALIVQGSHVIEHLVRVAQYVGGGGDAEGLVTKWVDPVWFHFGINLVFLGTMVWAFFGLRLHRDFRN